MTHACDVGGGWIQGPPSGTLPLFSPVTPPPPPPPDVNSGEEDPGGGGAHAAGTGPASVVPPPDGTFTFTSDGFLSWRLTPREARPELAAAWRGRRSSGTVRFLSLGAPSV